MDKPLFSENWYRVRNLKPRLRSHVKLHRQVQADQVWYMLEDPASGRFHRFNTAAYNVIALMNGERTVDAIWEQANTALGDDGPVQDDVILLLGQLHRIDVLQSNIPPDVAEILDRRRQQRRARRLGRVVNPLSLRIPVLDPNSFLDNTLPLVRWCFSAPLLWAWMAIVSLAIATAAINWPALMQTATYQALTPSNLLLLLVIYPFVKLLHELGHAYAAKLEGGEVHELGVIFMVFVPVPYVDASAATAFSSRRKRILVGAIGVMIELLLATTALFIWLSVSPGLVSSICFNVMLIGGVSTVVFNGNPLLRFDGYYVLSDLLGIPNLGQRANAYYGYLVQHFGFGLETAVSPAQSRWESGWFLLYAPLSLVYRLGILATICLFLLEDFFFVGVALALWAVSYQVLWPLLKQTDFVFMSPRLRKHRTRAVLVSVSVIGGFAAALTWWPVASLSNFEGVIYPPEQSRLISGTDGFVTAVLVENGERVQAGQPLMQLQNIFHDGVRKSLEARMRELRARYAAVRTADRVQARLTRGESAALRADLARIQEKIDSLKVTAPVDGIFFQLPIGELEGVHIDRGDLLGYVVPESAATARVVVVQDDLDRIQSRVEAIEVRLASDPWEVHEGELSRSVPQAGFRLPSSVLSTNGGGRYVTSNEDPLVLASGERVFEFEINLPATPASTRIGTRVFVRFDHGAEPLAAQWYRSLQQLFLRRLPG
jgi:putative peptide zinc metalloprotease protein